MTDADQSADEIVRFFNVRLRVTNQRTGVSQIHDVLVESTSDETAEETARRKVLSDDEDEFETIEVSDLAD